MSTIPLQSACRSDDPEEHVLWALVGLPGAVATAPLVLPPDVMKKWSEHLYKCGFRHHKDLQEIKYVPPGEVTNWVHGAGGQWVPMDTDLGPYRTAPDVSHLSLGEKQVLLERLQREMRGE